MRGENWIKKTKNNENQKTYLGVGACMCQPAAVPVWSRPSEQLEPKRELDRKEESTGAEREGSSRGSVDVAPGGAHCRAVSPSKQRLPLATATWDCRAAGCRRCGTWTAGLANRRQQTALPAGSLVTPL